MTSQREPVVAETGDWVVYTKAHRESWLTKTFGGPWSHAKLLERKVGGWNAKPQSNSNIFLYDREIVRVTLSRGEAIDLADKLNETQAEYIRERDNLKPRFQTRIDALLNK